MLASIRYCINESIVIVAEYTRGKNVRMWRNRRSTLLFDIWYSVIVCSDDEPLLDSLRDMKKNADLQNWMISYRKLKKSHLKVEVHLVLFASIFCCSLQFRSNFQYGLRGERRLWCLKCTFHCIYWSIPIKLFICRTARKIVNERRRGKCKINGKWMCDDWECMCVVFMKRIQIAWNAQPINTNWINYAWCTYHVLNNNRHDRQPYRCCAATS